MLPELISFSNAQHKLHKLTKVIINTGSEELAGAGDKIIQGTEVNMHSFEASIFISAETRQTDSL